MMIEERELGIERRMREFGDILEYERGIYNYEDSLGVFTIMEEDAKLRKIINGNRGREGKVVVSSRVDSILATKYVEKFKRKEYFEIKRELRFYESSVEKGSALGIITVKLDMKRCIDLFNPMIIKRLNDFYGGLTEKDKGRYKITGEIELAMLYYEKNKSKYSSIRGLKQGNGTDKSKIVKENIIVYYIMDSNGIKGISSRLLK